jgi:hypothetical protein
MELKEERQCKKQAKVFRYSNGVLYFSKRIERAVFFLLTIMMLGLGLLVKLGLW